MHLNRVAAATALLASIGGMAAMAQPIVVDGRFDDWPAATSRIDDARGDASGSTDLLGLSARRSGEFVYVWLEIASPANLQKPDDDGGIRLVIRGQKETITLDTGRRHVERSGQPVPWSDVAYTGLPTHAANEFEIRMRAPEGPLSISVNGSDSLDQPLELGPDTRPVPSRRIDVRRGDSPLRVVAWNVLWGGPFEDRAREADGRTVVETLDPDVLLLQEVWDIPDFEQRVREVCGEEWSVYEMGGAAVASRLTLTPLALDPPVELDGRRRPAGGDSWSVMRSPFVGVDTPVGPVVVVSAHWKCCGSTGSAEDLQRMDDALVVLKAIWRLRDAGTPAPPTRRVPPAQGGCPRTLHRRPDHHRGGLQPRWFTGAVGDAADSGLRGSGPAAERRVVRDHVALAG